MKDNLNKKKEDLERIIDIDTEPQYWEKERYTLDTINQVLGQEKAKEREIGEER